jgi:7-cyano-7-deazaguanine reductase
VKVNKEMMKTRLAVVENPLGKTVTYTEIYTPSLLCPIPRVESRAALGISELPFHGVDIWNCYEVSWLNKRGKPDVAVLEIHVPCASDFMIESKSLKLYLNSFNGTRFDSRAEVQQTIESDLGVATRSVVLVNLSAVSKSASFQEGRGTLLDDLDIEVNTYQVDPTLLAHASGQRLSESLHTNLFKTNCPVTGQPDWATLTVNYQGDPIDKASLLRYLVSYRQHQGYHESSVEQIYRDIMKHLGPDELTVYARYTRRGGIDINPFRSNFEQAPGNLRTFRQ